MKCVAVGDIFITPEMMNTAMEKYGNLIDRSDCFYFGDNDRQNMRNVVKIIERGEGNSCEIPDGLTEAVNDAEIMMVHLCPISAEFIYNAPKLKYILCNRGGIENVDVGAATKRGIKVFNNPAHNANAVAEYTVGLIFNETRNISRANYALKNGEWRERYPNSGKISELKDLTIGIIGYGNIGKLLCQKLQGFGCNILINSLTVPGEKDSSINWDKTKFVDKHELLKRSDIVTLHVRSEDKKVIIGQKEFSEMKNTAYLINTSRPYMIDYDALYFALKNKEIKGAAIDVFSKEPLDPDEKLLSLDNITLTNHRAGDTINAYADSPAMMLKELEKLITKTGKPLFMLN